MNDYEDYGFIKDNGPGHAEGCKGFIFNPGFGPDQCSNALCTWNLKKYNIWDRQAGSSMGETERFG